MKIRRGVIFFVSIFPLALSAVAQQQEQSVPFRTAIELAVRNSSVSASAEADLQRARAAYSQTRDLFLPQMIFGSGLAWSYGFPLSLEGSAPSIFNVNVQGYLLNAAQRNYVRAARKDVAATEAQAAAHRADVILEAATDYIQLDQLQSALGIQQEQIQLAAQYENTVNQRVQAGLDSQVELTRAKLVSARTRMAIAQNQAAMDQLRQRLSQLTGLPVTSIRTSTESIPKLPEVTQQQDLAQAAVAASPDVKTAEQTAESKAFRAQAEHKQLYPAVDLVGQYAMLARYNNYDVFFNSFQRHNATLGVAIRFPFFNPAQKAVAQSADADALKARKDVQTVKDQVSSETLKLQRSVEALSAAKDVANLEHDLSESDISTVHAKIESGTATLKDEQGARITERQQFTAFLNSSFELDKAQLQLLRQTGQLESWATGTTKP